ncbi:O-antigen ligase family protein [Polynucleobacter sp. AP-Jannik-300A-C4]|uniref:O-antigen ligase family protein n=1 Tax=Polynucleobacter sp. AP-Jannik-300A-C4 TaxID=2576928 RepID=UPI001BFE67AB|nr:O-antigen ligase family protein [Polynucleobacter sp. AP-Jannik-300A-C4]QWE22879.1 O-antigen ligase family protein [Polynucleobacter sp. AP-Jannik-300A-C4]
MKLNLNHAYTKLDWFVILCVFMFPVTFLTVRHGVHVSLFALVLLAAYHFWSAKAPKIEWNYPIDPFILLTFAGLFLSVLLSQVFRGAMHFAAFDGPSRILLAGLVFLLLKSLNIPYIRILEIAIPLALICIFGIIVLRPLDPHWMGRYSMYFVDPNTLGSQAFILGLLSLLMISWDGRQSKALMVLQVLGGILGLYVSVGSGSRGGWLIAPFILLLILLLRFGDISHASNLQKQKMWLQTLAICIGICFVSLIGFYFSEKLSTRIISGYFEILHWFTGANLDTSAGTRLSMWKFGFQFANESLLFGYGEEKNMMQVLQGSPLNIAANETAINTMALTGPHSDILSKLLSAGLFGLGAYLSLLLVPFSIFWKRRNALDFNVKQAARIGLFYITGIFIAGLSNEQLSLKYLCTFYGMMVAVLLAQVFHKPSAGRIN